MIADLISNRPVYLPISVNAIFGVWGSDVAEYPNPIVFNFNYFTSKSFSVNGDRIKSNVDALHTSTNMWCRWICVCI